MKRVMRYKVHIGYTKKGRARYRRFPTLPEASTFCSTVFNKTGVVLSITEN